MSTIIDFESHRAAKRQKESEAVDEAAMGMLDFDLSGLITKEDLAQVRAETKVEIAEMETRVAEFETRVNGELAQMRRRLRRVELLLAVRIGLYMVSGAVSALLGVYIATLI
ncbi:MAG: hypothetical protein GC191_02445 [Azospirillum sp.]|nr:hypothetical protein [Azospirillum sp.]